MSARPCRASLTARFTDTSSFTLTGERWRRATTAWCSDSRANVTNQGRPLQPRSCQGAGRGSARDPGHLGFPRCTVVPLGPLLSPGLSVRKVDCHGRVTPDHLNSPTITDSIFGLHFQRRYPTVPSIARIQRDATNVTGPALPLDINKNPWILLAKKRDQRVTPSSARRSC